MMRSFLVLLLLFPSVAFSAPICGMVYGPPTQATVVNDYITGENGTDIERITSKSGPYTLCGAPSFNPYWIGSDQVRWYWLEGDSCPYDRYYTFYYTSGGSCTSSCSDGVINQDETDYDLAGGECGGVCGDCTPAEPSYCSDGEQSDDEMGIDCGPSCTSPDDSCSIYCPVGFNAETRLPDNITACYSDDSNTDYYALVKLDTCPDDMFRSATDDELCVSWTFATSASHDYLDGVDSPEINTTPWNNVVTDETTTNYNSVVLVDGVTTEVVNSTTESLTTDGSASEQVTTETTVTQVDGSSTVTTITETTTKDVSGSVSGQLVTVTDNYDSSGVLLDSATTTDNIENTPGAGDSFQAPTSGIFEVDQELFDSFTVRYEDFYAEIENAPIYTPVSNLFSGPDTSAKSPDFSLAMGSYGTKSFALSTYDQVWNALGVLFIFLATLTTARMIMVRGFSGGN